MFTHTTHFGVLRRNIAAALVVAICVWTLPAFWGSQAQAAQLTSVSDTLSNSAPGENSNHTIQYISTTTATAGQTIKIQLDPLTDAFGLGSLTSGDISVSGFTLVGACGVGTDEATVSIDATAPDENVTFTVCTSDSIGTGTKIVNFNNNRVVNPATPGSYTIRIAGTQADSGDTMVAIVNPVVMSAAVDTSLTFTITGVANGASVNGDAVTTSTTTTSTLIPFGTLASGTPKVAAQDLAVSTNAPGGYAVTIRQNQNLTSSAGADIDVFKDGEANVTPTAWTVPTANTSDEKTWGHYGVTSEDATLPAGDEFGTALYAGNFATTSRVVMYHNGISDGSTANIGATRVGFKIQITSMQEAGNDYTNTFTYVCTPVF